LVGMDGMGGLEVKTERITLFRHDKLAGIVPNWGKFARQGAETQSEGVFTTIGTLRHNRYHIGSD